MKETALKHVEHFPIHSFQKKLIDWFLREGRDLPWRRDKDPYKIWVSEVMLQQTRVDTVIPYFHNFIEQFPSIDALASADEQKLLKAWEGLGYYSRVKNLHAAVKEVKERYGGVVPKDKEAFSQLKGVGPYTTGAVLSIAYGLPIPAVDGNVMRVLSRIFYIQEDIAKGRTKKLFEEIAQYIISHEDPSSFNQGLMELGALVCKPSNPSCLLCPVNDFCEAFKRGEQHLLPVKSKGKKGKTIQLTAAVLLSDDGKKVLLRKRPSSGLLADLWEFPSEEQKDRNFTNLLAEYEKALYGKHEINVHLKQPLCHVEHIFSHLKWEIKVFFGFVDGKVEETSRLKMVSIDSINHYPLPVPHQKIWEQFLIHRDVLETEGFQTGE
ncbi:A/G-specific adenine glycosylase [Fervidibacillus halotolerans]|uniref:Adenine DNA glycosylase n=1 Tax=Fervidibacillus halotolerans TaxID=2980027 RepID=A0A9E8M0F7_9BACI|nr:A/G-specific adenine glycosylase [Fervidibacillus halotolerans]WAA12934.1 A/G-specific adenine glycosylase [Fervidibacillus halotolerans]